MGRWEEAERKFSSFIPPLSPPTATSSFRFHIISSLFKPCCNSLLWRIFSGIHTLLQPLCYIPVQVNLHKKDAACEEQTAPPVLKGCRMRPCDMGSPKDASMRHLEPIVGKTMCELIQALVIVCEDMSTKKTEERMSAWMAKDTRKKIQPIIIPAQGTVITPMTKI
ncbi:hypothetical protein J6590_012049 [Homalodisca vitripennis]|nr:hypothetical protein J6590_012049 [Homalodisca vitripennis]